MKQIKNKYFTLFLFAGLIFSLQSCLKNNDYYEDFSKGSPAVELPLAAKYTNKPFALALDVSATPTDYYVVVNVASVDIPKSPVTATLAIDQAYLDQYNTTQAAADPNFVPYELLPDSAYDIPSLEATIPAGQRLDTVPISLYTSKIESGHKYVLALTISNSSVNISNWNHLLVNITAKNRFDGRYSVTGTFVDVTSATNVAFYPQNIDLVTQGVTLDAYFDELLGGYGYVFDTGGGLSYFGNWAPVFEFDDNGNVTAVTNYYDDPAPRSRMSMLDTSPGTVNKYDFATKSMDVSYFMLQSGSVRLKIHEIFTYLGPRK